MQEESATASQYCTNADLLASKRKQENLPTVLFVSRISSKKAVLRRVTINFTVNVLEVGWQNKQIVQCVEKNCKIVIIQLKFNPSLRALLLKMSQKLETQEALSVLKVKEARSGIKIYKNVKKVGRISNTRDQDQLSQAQEADSDLQSIQEVSEPSGQDLLNENPEDYKQIEILDQYEREGIDDATGQNELSFGQRQEVERMLDARDRQQQTVVDHSRYAALLGNESFDQQELNQRMLQRMRVQEGSQLGEQEAKYDIEDLQNEEESLFDRIQKPRIRRMIQKRFENFLKSVNLQDQSQPFVQKLRDLMKENKQSLIVEFDHLSIYDSVLTQWILEMPRYVLPLLNEVAYGVAYEENHQIEQIMEKIFVRIACLPVDDKMRDLRQTMLNGMVRVGGVVTKRTSIHPQLIEAYYTCTRCGLRKGPYLCFDGVDNNDLGLCSLCQSAGPFTLDQRRTLYRNFQRMTIQEPPSTVPAGRMPRQKVVILTNDLVDQAKPGDHLFVTGAYLNQRSLGLSGAHGYALFDTLIEANFIEIIGEVKEGAVTPGDVNLMRQYARSPNIFNKLFNSIAPSIHGLYEAKRAICLSMFGGAAKDIEGHHRIRGDINVLLLGDPGMAKSQLLKYVEKLFPRSVLTSGKGASAVGLTAGVHRDMMTREWVLEGGALVLADKGICLIDEFDKMNETDRVSIHEAMEQQTISISKAGIVSTLQARCAVIAAANPIRGEYDNSMGFSENVNLSEPILSRFDVLCVMRDEVNTKEDRNLANFIMKSHIANHPKLSDNRDREEEDEAELEANQKYQPDINEFSQTFLKKYIMYARTKSPRLQDFDQRRLVDVYTQVRKISDHHQGIKLTIRHFESMIRLAEGRFDLNSIASARMSLSETVSYSDCNFAIRVILDSFISTQKRNTQTVLKRLLSKYLFDRMESKQCCLQILENQVKTKVKLYQDLSNNLPDKIPVSLRAFEEQVKNASYQQELNAFYNCIEFRQKYRKNQEANVIEVDTSKLDEFQI